MAKLPTPQALPQARTSPLAIERIIDQLQKQGVDIDQLKPAVWTQP